MANDKLKRDVQLDSHFSHEERIRNGVVMGEADLEYGMVSGFRRGILQTGLRTKKSDVGKKVR